MPIQNINGKTVYVITPAKVESAQDSTGNSWATMYARQRKLIWDEISKEANVANELQADLLQSQREMINRRIMNLEDNIGALQRGELTAKQTIQANNDDNATSIEKAKLDAAEISTSSRSSTGSSRSGGSAGSGSSTGAGNELSLDEKRVSSAIITGTLSQFNAVDRSPIDIGRDLATKLQTNADTKLTNATEQNVINLNGVRQLSVKETATQLYNKMKAAGRSEEEANDAYNAFLDSFTGTAYDTDVSPTGTDDGSGSSGGGGYASSSSYRKATPQEAIDKAKASVGVAPDAREAIAEAQAKIAALEGQLGGLPSGMETARSRFAQEVGGIWGFADRPSLTQNYQQPAGTTSRVDDLIDTYKAAATKALAQSGIPIAGMTDEEITQAAMTMLRRDMNLRTDDSGYRPISEESYMRELVPSEVAAKPGKPLPPARKPPFSEVDPQVPTTYSPPYEPTRRAPPVKSPDRNDEKEKGKMPPSRGLPTVRPGDLERDWEGQDPQSTSTNKMKAQRSREAMLALLEADKLSDDPKTAARYDKKDVASKIYAMAEDPAQALAEVERAYPDEPAKQKKARNQYLVMYLTDSKKMA